MVGMAVVYCRFLVKANYRYCLEVGKWGAIASGVLLSTTILANNPYG